MDFVLDIETLDVESTAVVASVGCIAVDFTKDFEFEDLVNVAFYAKLNTKDQIDLGRTVGQDTLDWWNRQDAEVRKSQLSPSPNDVSLFDGIEAMKAYFKSHDARKSSVIWTRGELDNMVLSSAAKAVKTTVGYPYNKIRDIRTAIDFLSGSTNGYSAISKPIPEYAKKHNPVYDCAIDAMMLKYYVVEG